MNPSEHTCHNPQCSLYGQADKSNIVIHSQKEKRLKCTCCKKTFSHRKGSAYENIKKPTAIFERTFREKVKFKRNSRVHWPYQVPDQISMLQLVKSYSRQGRRYLCKGVHKIVLAVGEWQVANSLLKALNTTPRANTSYIERLNATFRTCLVAMRRRTRNVAHHIHTIEYALWLKVTTYNFCTFHRNLSQTTKQTPAMAQGIINRKLRVKQLLAIPKNAQFLSHVIIHDIM